MGSRFILIFAIAKLLTPAEVGLFGLMLATVSFSVLVIGADYYTYAQRELLARPPEQWSFVLQHQAKAQLLLYVILIPAQLIVFIAGWMDWKYAVWFFVLLIVEHIAQEINRILVAMHKQLMASWVLFVRMGSWVLLVIPLMVIKPEFQNLKTLYTAWLVGALFAIALGLWGIKRVIPIWRWYKLDLVWLKKGFKVGGLFLIATICFKGLLTFDRYVVEALSDLEVLGVYVFFIGVVMGLYNFLDPAVFSFLYPRMLQSYQMGEKQQYLKAYKELIVTTIAISLALGAVIWTIMPFIIGWIDKPIYTQYLDALVLLVLAGFMYAISHIPHYALYAMKGDKWIVGAHISALAVFFVSVYMFQMQTGIHTVALALILAFTSMGMIKQIGYFYTKQHSVLLKA